MKPVVQNSDSPCIRNCCLDESDICVGCYRHLDEILAWNTSSESERCEIIAKAQQRAASTQTATNGNESDHER